VTVQGNSFNLRADRQFACHKKNTWFITMKFQDLGLRLPYYCTLVMVNLYFFLGGAALEKCDPEAWAGRQKRMLSQVSL
jgi:hypothetical protein